MKFASKLPRNNTKIGNIRLKELLLHLGVTCALLRHGSVK
ncbi:hypothetical protein CPter291_2371 [Collimonas pratensis]|uniref:Uncharacterized protein n=1 Tax=Collimonas pratensis TaxID=279113 RepID=A0A127Q5F0_9BURK|nr:hypothetical protein CPter91_2952 [Collimonas pratensis]AMP14628.1 hypothetical protein CPter291_2371 [Collimonas pratensis]